MKQAIIQSLRFVRDCFIKLSEEIRAVGQINGVPEKVKCWPWHINVQVVDIDNGVKKVTEKFTKVDTAKMGLRHKR